MPKVRLMTSTVTAGEKKELLDNYIHGKVLVLPISIGQANTIGDQGLATLRLLSQNADNITYVIPASTLQRHNYQAENNLNLEAAQELSKLKGLEWQQWFNQQQKEKSKKIHNSYMKDWDEWRLHPAYQQFESYVNDIYEENTQDFAAIVKSTAALFLSKKIKYFPIEKAQLLLNASIAYLKEEVAVTLLWIQIFQDQYPSEKIIQLYPKEPNSALVHLYKKILTTEQKKYFEFVTINYVNKNVTSNLLSESIIT